MAKVSSIKVLESEQDSATVLARGREVVRIEAEALALLEQSLDESFVAACRLILTVTRRLVVTGMGKSGHIARKLAATFSATGTPAMFLHPAEASHGDLGMVTEGDVLLVLSNSGNTRELHAVVAYARDLGVSVIGVTARGESLVAEQADVTLRLPQTREACAANIAPTTSTALQLALGDALAMAVMDMRGISERQLHAFHPGGNIGIRLTPIREIMHGVNDLPLVRETALMPEVISVMSAGRFGLAGVVSEAGDLLGVITDGDLRRHFAQIATANAANVMTPTPKSMPADMLAGDALLFLSDAKITAAFVLDRLDRAHPSRPIGIVHIHDLLRFGLN
jgi:arabinose-5-phosphate isomerase